MRRAQLADFYMGPIIHYLEPQQFPADAMRREPRIIQQRSREFVIGECCIALARKAGC